MKKIVIKFDIDHQYSLDWLEANSDAAQNIYEKYKGTHPHCLCQPGEGFKLYIAKKKIFYLAKMPLTGDKHASYCPFFGAPPTMSGMSVYRKTAITENDDDTLSIKLSVGLGVPKEPDEECEEPGSSSSSSTKSDGKKGKLSLLALLHLIWVEAAFNKWVPRMKGKRNYHVLFKYLYSASDKIKVKKQTLDKYLYIPRPFNSNTVEENKKRTDQLFYKLLLDTNGNAKRMISIGLIKKIFQSDHGYGIQLRHAPANITFWANEKVITSFADSLNYAESIEDLVGEDDTYIAAIFLVERSKKGHLIIQKAAGMRITKDYIPFDDDHHRQVISELMASNRIFTKQLRFDSQDKDDIFPDFLLLDASLQPIPMHIIGNKPGKDHDKKVRERILHYQNVGEQHWYWDSAWSGETIPQLPDVLDKTATN